METIDYNDYDNNGPFNFDVFKALLCLIITIIICFIITKCVN